MQSYLYTTEERLGECLVYRLTFKYSDELLEFLPIGESYDIEGTTRVVINCNVTLGDRFTCEYRSEIEVVSPVPLSLNISFPIEVEFKLWSLYPSVEFFFLFI